MSGASRPKKSIRHALLLEKGNAHDELVRKLDATSSAAKFFFALPTNRQKLKLAPTIFQFPPFQYACGLHLNPIEKFANL